MTRNGLQPFHFFSLCGVDAPGRNTGILDGTHVTAKPCADAFPLSLFFSPSCLCDFFGVDAMNFCLHRFLSVAVPRIVPDATCGTSLASALPVLAA